MGTYFSVEHNECASCWLGSYQDQEGQLECKSCPEGSSTAYLHSRSITECKGEIDLIQSVLVLVWNLLLLYICRAMQARHSLCERTGDLRVVPAGSLPAGLRSQGLSRLS